MAGSLDALSVKELKEYCRQRGHTDFSACVEKTHLVDLARSLDAARSSAGPSAAGATEPPSPDPAKRKTSGVSGPEGWKACSPLVGRAMLFFFVGSESESPNSKHLFQAGVIDADGPEQLAVGGLTVIKRALEAGVSLKPWSPYGDGGDSNNPL